MTVLAWDGKTLAADKRALNQGLISTVTKIWKIKEGPYAGCLIGCTGDLSDGIEVQKWFENGAVRDDYPDCQKDRENASTIMLIAPNRRTYKLTFSSYPMLFEDAIMAIGSGRDFALAAMYCGKTAKEAVEIACIFESGCGNGVDTLTLED